MPAFARLYQSYAEPASAKGSVRIAREPAECDARLDGKLVLATDTDLSAAEVARSYQLSEPVTGGPHLPRGEIYPKGRPIYHHRDDASIGHIVASFLALRLEVDLQRQ